jgi:hypothetical protein
MNKTWHVVLAFLVVFVAGGAIGSILELHYGPKLPAPNALPRPEQFMPQLAKRWMNNQLNLSANQKEKILPVINDAAEDMRRLRGEATHNGELILEHMQDEIAAVLTPAQRIRFDNLIETNRARLRQFSLQQGGWQGKKGGMGKGQGQGAPPGN